jgi:hypothetical protein
MPMKLYATNIASADSAAAIDVREDMTIEGIYLNLTYTVPVDGNRIKAEVSFGSTNSFTSNDTTASLASIALAQEAGAAGLGQLGHSVYIPMAEKVQAGERLYLHVFHGIAGSTSEATAFIYGGGTARPSTRRR